MSSETDPAADPTQTAADDQQVNELLDNDTPATEQPATEAPATEAPPAEPAPATETQPAPTETPAATPPGTEPPAIDRAPVPLEPDELDKEFETALKLIAEDELLTPGQKAKETLELKVQREQRNKHRQVDVIDQEQAARNAEAAKLGVNRQQFDSAWDTAVRESAKELGYFSRDAAVLLMRRTIAEGKKAPAAATTSTSNKPAPTPQPVQPSPARRVPIQARPGTVAPPASAVTHRPPAPSKDPGEDFDRSVTREDLASFV